MLNPEPECICGFFGTCDKCRQRRDRILSQSERDHRRWQKLADTAPKPPFTELGDE